MTILNSVEYLMAISDIFGLSKSLCAVSISNSHQGTVGISTTDAEPTAPCLETPPWWMIMQCEVAARLLLRCGKRTSGVREENGD